MGLRLCEVVKDDEAMHFDALAQQPRCGHATMTRSANALCSLLHAQGDRAKAQSIRVCRLGATQPSHRDGDGDMQPAVARAQTKKSPSRGRARSGWRRRRDSNP